MIPYVRWCVALALVVPFKVELHAQWSFEAGPARLAMPVEPAKAAASTGQGPAGLSLPAHVSIFQGGKLTGQGELLRWLPKAGMAELRAVLPKGSFRLGTPRPLVAPWEAAGEAGGEDERNSGRAKGPPGSRAWIRVADLEIDFEWQEGWRFARHHAQGSRPSVALRCDLYRYPGHGVEIRLRLCAGQRYALDAALRVQGAYPSAWSQGRDLRLCPSFAAMSSELGWSTGLRRSSGAGAPALRTWTLSIPAGYLRPGDEIEFVFLATEGRDPEERAIGPPVLRKRLGQGVSRPALRPCTSLRRRLDADLSRLVAETGSLGPQDRGDHPRTAATRDRPVLWSHQEFDLPLGLHLLGCERRESRLLSEAWRGLQHLMGRDRSRPWRNETLGYRLPVRHGAQHGIGRVALGHVFLESALLVSALRANRSLHQEAIESLDALSDLVPRSIREASKLRDLVWPLLDLEMGLRLVDRGSWRKSAASLLEFLDRIFRDGSFDLRESRLPGGARSLDLWLVSGLLLPALDASVQRGSGQARSLRRRLLDRIGRLPGASGGFSTRYATDARGRWHASRAKVDPCYEIWLIEGLLGRSKMPGSLRSRRRRLLSKLPGGIWDPATRLAFLLRWPRLRAQLCRPRVDR